MSRCAQEQALVNNVITYIPYIHSSLRLFSIDTTILLVCAVVQCHDIDNLYVGMTVTLSIVYTVLVYSITVLIVQYHVVLKLTMSCKLTTDIIVGHRSPDVMTMQQL